MKPIHISLNTAHSGCKQAPPCHLLHALFLSLPLPLLFSPTTSTFLQADTQSSPLSTHHLNLSCLTTSATFWTPKRLYKTSLHFLSLRDTPHIHLTIIHCAPSRLSRFSSFIAYVSFPVDTVNTVRTQENKNLYLWHDALRVVRMGDSSLNLAQAHRTLSLAASSTPPPAQSVSLK